MRSRDAHAERVQVYLSDQNILAALHREARQGRISLSQAAARSLERGLRYSATADPDDRLLKLERSLRDHMRATARDIQIVQELMVEVARAFFLRLPDAAIDEDPAILAMVDHRVERMLDATAARIIAGASRTAAARASASGATEPAGDPTQEAAE